MRLGADVRMSEHGWDLSKLTLSSQGNWLWLSYHRGLRKDSIWFHSIRLEWQGIGIRIRITLHLTHRRVTFHKWKPGPLYLLFIYFLCHFGAGLAAGSYRLSDFCHCNCSFNRNELPACRKTGWLSHFVAPFIYILSLTLPFALELCFSWTYTSERVLPACTSGFQGNYRGSRIKTNDFLI